MVQDHLEAARQQFEDVVKLEPKDELAAKFAKALNTSSHAQTAGAPDAAPASKTAEVLEASPPPAALVGTWKAKPMPDPSIELTLRGTGQFAWGVNAKGRSDSVTGDARYLEGVLTLTQADAPDLICRMVNLGDKQFGFELLGSLHAATILFSR
jgi:hypothetical protein